MHSLLNYLPIVLILTLFSSCAHVCKTKDGMRINGKISFKTFHDNDLNDKSIIQGYAYSRHSKIFLKNARILLDNDRELETDSNGFFQTNVNQGKHTIECRYVGNNDLKSKQIDIKKGDRIFILFELGTRIMY